jgi:hypothetical protein
MYVAKKDVPILLVTVIAVLVFGAVFLVRRNFEFLIYVGVVLFFIWAVLASNAAVRYPSTAFLGLGIWALLHMAGGAVYVGEGTRLYDLMLLPLSQNYPVLRYDQFVHMWGFATAAFVFYCVLAPHLKKDAPFRTALFITVVLVGLGASAINEILEFIVSELFDAGVGGYLNTSLDLISNLIGSIIAAVLIKCGILKTGDQ